jgi:uncharacterized DUF497 family protein
MEFEWDARKAQSNLQKHRVSSIEAAGAFADSFALLTDDLDHSWDEPRNILLGRGESGRLLVVTFTHRGTTIRLISARLATSAEGQQYGSKG